GHDVRRQVPASLQLSCRDVVQVAQAPDLGTAVPDVIDDVRSGVERSAERRAKRAVVSAVAPVRTLDGYRSGNQRRQRVGVSLEILRRGMGGEKERGSCRPGWGAPRRGGL